MKIGDIVVYNTTEQERNWMELQGFTSKGSSNIQKQLPAIVVAVWGDTCINAQVITDGANSGFLWKTSIQKFVEGQTEKKDGFWE